jgi:hypothetical protein
MPENDEGPLGPVRIDWGPVKRDVETSGDTLVEIAKRHGLRHGTLTQQVCRKGWLRPWEDAARAKAKRAALDPGAAIEDWTAMIGKSIDTMLSCQSAIEGQIKESGEIEELKKLHAYGTAALERSVRVVGQFAKIIKERAAARADDDEPWDTVSELERQLFARAGIGVKDQAGD